MEVNKADIKLIIGLGNPDKKYENSFHNAGFLFINHLAEKSGLEWKKSKNFEYFKVGGKILVKTTEFMNESGKAVSEAVKYFSLGNAIKPEHILIVHDDSDIELGKYKLQFNRSSAGHKGVESIINALKTQKFWRLRIGIGGIKTGLLARLRSRRMAGDLVLKKISPAELKKMGGIFQDAANIIFPKNSS